jgi:truncated hemoglobin YjbI
MTQSQSPSFHDVFAHFRSVTNGLGELPADSQILLLELELFQALRRAADADDRNRHLERKLDEARGAIELYAEQHRERSARAARDRESIKDAYERELRLLQEAYAAVKERCRALDDVCRSLLLTIERAACAEPAGVSHKPAHARAPA